MIKKRQNLIFWSSFPPHPLMAARLMLFLQIFQRYLIRYHARSSSPGLMLSVFFGPILAWFADYLLVVGFRCCWVTLLLGRFWPRRGCLGGSQTKTKASAFFDSDFSKEAKRGLRNSMEMCTGGDLNPSFRITTNVNANVW